MGLFMRRAPIAEFSHRKAIDQDMTGAVCRAVCFQEDGVLFVPITPQKGRTTGQNTLPEPLINQELSIHGL